MAVESILFQETRVILQLGCVTAVLRADGSNVRCVACRSGGLCSLLFVGVDNRWINDVGGIRELISIVSC